MNLQSRLLGTVVKFAEIKQGDLYIAEDGKSARLIFVIQNGSSIGGLVLKEWGTPTCQRYPDMALNLHYQQGSGRVRRIDGDISIEPLDATAEMAFAPHTGEHGNGSLCATPDSKPAIYVMWENYRFLYDLANGENVEIKGEWPYIIRNRWRLVLRDGDDAITLCEFGAKSK